MPRPTNRGQEIQILLTTKGPLTTIQIAKTLNLDQFGKTAPIKAIGQAVRGLPIRYDRGSLFWELIAEPDQVETEPTPKRPRRKPGQALIYRFDWNASWRYPS